MKHILKLLKKLLKKLIKFLKKQLCAMIRSWVIKAAIFLGLVVLVIAAIYIWYMFKGSGLSFLLPWT